METNVQLLVYIRLTPSQGDEKGLRQLSNYEPFYERKKEKKFQLQ